MEILVQDICQAISDNRLNLPPLPETCLKIRKLLQDDNCSSRQLANTIAADAALSARIMKIANSAMYARQQPANDLSTAIQRLGNSLIGNLVNGLAIMPAFAFSQNRQHDINIQIRQHSMATAALAYGLCHFHSHLNHFEGYIAAILQNIGYIAILGYHKLPRELLADHDTMITMLNEQHISVGSHLLRHWQFPESLIAVQQKQNHFYRTHSNRVDYLDIIIAANVINGPLFPSPARALPGYSHIPAMQRLNLNETSLDSDLAAIQPAIQEARYIFQVSM